MSYTEGSEQELGLVKDAIDYSKRFNSVNSATGFLSGAVDYRAKIRKVLREQLDFAEGRLIQATNQEVYDEKLKWSGYIQALRFIQSEL